jgi:UDP-N-acetylmuramoylalanine--D-glutamate ligase
MKIAILGFGREGKSLLRFFKKAPRYRGAEIEILDQKQGKDYLKNLQRFDLVFRSPGVPYNLPEIQRAIKRDVKFSSATKLFFDLCPATIIGVTGTKGKGTTSTILYKILKKENRDVYLAGNIGVPAVDILPKLKKNSVVILELSSFQLQDLKKSPPVAVVVDTFPDHLDAHKTIKEYLDAKTNIVKYQKKSDVVFYFADNDWSKKIALRSPGKKIPLRGEPFGLRKNKTMAAAVAASLHCPPETIGSVIKNFRGLKHRMELVRSITLKSHSYVLKNVRMTFYNDSASTNPQTAAAAILSLSRHPHTLNAKPYPLILIAGGKDKNLDYAPLAEAIRESENVSAVVLFGENKGTIMRQVSGVRCQVKLVKNLNLAVSESYKIAKKLINSQTHQLITILFSPASASFDMFKDYADRGEQFKKIVKSLKTR